MIKKKLILMACVLLIGLAGCQGGPTTGVAPGAPNTPTPALTGIPSLATTQPTSVPSLTSSTAAHAAVPDFSHIVVILFENHEFDAVIGNQSMPYYNQLAGENTLLTRYYAVTHPSLPNYIALFGGDTFGISTDCTDCFIKAASLADQI